MSEQSTGVRARISSTLTRLLSKLFGPAEHVLAFVPVPEKPEWVPHDAKVDYLYWLTLLKRLKDDFGLRPTNFLEVGANCAQDAWFISRQLDLESSAVAVVEPVHTNAQIIRRNTPFRLFECAVTEVESEVHLWVPVEDESLWGMASLGERAVGDAGAFRSLVVEAMSGYEIVNQLDWSRVDLLKIDVEGFSAQVLRSFGDALSRVLVIQIETERVEVWEGQETEDAVFSILTKAGFTMIDYQLAHDGVQADSVWVNSVNITSRVFDRQRKEWKIVGPKGDPAQ